MQITTDCEKLGEGEVVFNCMDKDGINSGFNHELINVVKDVITILVITLSGAG